MGEPNGFLCTSGETAETVRETIPSESAVKDLAELFKAVGDPTRIRILYALAQGEFCVGDLAQMLDISQTAVSHQLRVLKNSRLVAHRKEGKIVFYRLERDFLSRFAPGHGACQGENGRCPAAALFAKKTCIGSFALGHICGILQKDEI